MASKNAGTGVVPTASPSFQKVNAYSSGENELKTGRRCRDADVWVSLNETALNPPVGATTWQAVPWTRSRHQHWPPFGS